MRTSPLNILPILESSQKLLYTCQLFPCPTKHTLGHFPMISTLFARQKDGKKNVKGTCLYWALQLSLQSIDKGPRPMGQLSMPGVY